MDMKMFSGPQLCLCRIPNSSDSESLGPALHACLIVVILDLRQIEKKILNDYVAIGVESGDKCVETLPVNG